MAIIRSKYAQGIFPVPYPSLAGAATAMRFSHALTTAPAANDILELAPLYNGTRVIDMILDADDFDTGTGILIDVGLMSGKWQDTEAGRTCGAEFFAASNLLQAGGSARPSLKTAFRSAPAGFDRSIGIRFNTAATGFVAGVIGLTLIFGTD